MLQDRLDLPHKSATIPTETRNIPVVIFMKGVTRLIK